MTNQIEYFIGIDVGKAWLDVAVWETKESWKVKNNETGIASLIHRLEKLKPALIAVEATGGYEQFAVREMVLKGLKVAVTNPTRVRALSKATGKLAKTDVIDAHLIAEYAFTVKPEAVKPKTREEIQLQALVTRREQMVEIRAAEKNRMETAYSSAKEIILEHIHWLNACIDKVEEEIQRLIKSQKEWQQRVNRLLTIPGVGKVTAVTILAEMEEIGSLNRQEIASLAGLAPFNRDSGKKTGKRRIFGGRKGIRRVLYMACLSGIIHNPVIQSMYQRLLMKGKVFKVAITACMRKLLTIMNAMIRDQSDWSSIKVTTF
jgi:transposase